MQEVAISYNPVKKIILYILLAISAYFLYVGVSLVLMPPVAALADRKFNTTIQVKVWQGDFHPFVVGPKSRTWTPSGRIPAEMKWAVILAEDSNFYKHEGFDVKAIKNAIRVAAEFVKQDVNKHIIEELESY